MKRMLITFLFLSVLSPMSLAQPTADQSPKIALTIDRILDNPSLNGAAPNSLKIAPDGSRVTFLRGKSTMQEQMDLWEYAIQSKKTRLLVDSADLIVGDEKLSVEEQARRERQRTASLRGIVEYQFSPDGKLLLFPLNGDLYLYDLSKSGKAAVRQLTHGEGFATDSKVSPKGRFVSFIRDREVWIVEVASGRARALTHGAGALVSNGMAEFIAQEEMDRSTGYWWAPDESAIAFTQVDETRVPIQRRFEIQADRTDVIEQRYPAAGQANVQIKLGIAAITSSLLQDSTTKAGIEWVDLGSNDDIYLPRVNWTQDANRLSYQVQARDQRSLELRVFDRRNKQSTVLIRETRDTWVDLHNDLRFLKDGRHLIWASDFEGSKQLYLHDISGKRLRRISNSAWPIDNLLGVDENNDAVFAAGNGVDPLQKQVFRYGLRREAKPMQLSQESGWHEAVFAEDGSVFVSNHSDPNTPPRTRLFSSKSGKQLAVLEANALSAKHPYAPYLALHQTAEYGALKSEDGQDLYYGMLKPRDFDATKKYPAIVLFYGGPGRQFVQKSWNFGATSMLARYWAQQGYVVFALDNRGTPRRGVRFEHAIHRKMGGPDVADQLRGIRWLRDQAFVQADRIGVYGWSYGGYMALMMAAQGGDLIKAAAAGAPVTDWSLYDTHYTEHYMDHPNANVDGYKNGTVFAHLDGLRARLLLIHGMADDNVLFTNTTKLLADLQQRGIQFDFMGYPGSKHRIAAGALGKHVNHTIDAFFARELKN